MAKRFSNRDPEDRSAAAVLGVVALGLAIWDHDNLFKNPTQPQMYGLLALFLASCFFVNGLWYTEIDCDETGITGVRGRGRGRRIPWADVTAAEWMTEKHWTRGRSRHLKVSRILTVRPRTGKALVLRNMKPPGEFESLVSARTAHLAAPVRSNTHVVLPDGTIVFNPARGAWAAIACLIVITLACATSGHLAPLDVADLDSWKWWLILTLLPAVVLSPLMVLLGWSAFGQPYYRLSSSGNTLTVVRRRFGREETITGEWSRISEARYEIEKAPGQRDFIVDAGQPERLVFREAEYPGLVAWINERAPLDYEWIPLKSVGERRVLDKTGDYARVAKEQSEGRPQRS